MKFNESYKQPNNPEEDIEVIIKAQKILKSYSNIREKILDLDPYTIELIKSILKEKVYKKVFKDLDNEYDKLMEASEKLIDSPKSETPEIRKEREEIKDKLNKIMDLQESMRPMIDEIERSEFIIDNASKEEIDKAESFIAEIYLELDFAQVDSNLN